MLARVGLDTGVLDELARVRLDADALNELADIGSQSTVITR